MNPYRAIRTGLRILVVIAFVSALLAGFAFYFAAFLRADYWPTFGWMVLGIGAFAVVVFLVTFIWTLLEEGWKWLGRKAAEYDRMY